MKKNVFSLLSFLAILLAVLLVGCSKNEDPQPSDPPSDPNKIIIPVGTSYQGEMTVVNSMLIVSVAGQPDLIYALVPGHDSLITLSGVDAANRKGKSALLSLTTNARNLQGEDITVCYNYENGYTISSLQPTNQRVEFQGQPCGQNSDQIIIRVKATFQYASPGEYTVLGCGVSLCVSDCPDLHWALSPTADTVIILTGQDVANRLNKPYGLVFGANAIDKWGSYAEICYNYPSGAYDGSALLPDNQKIEFIGHKCN